MLISFFLGAASVFAFAPHRLWWLMLITLGWQFARTLNAPTTKNAFARGFAFGAGLFGAGVWWVFIALNTFGQMPGILAGIATALFCGYLALFPALAAMFTRWTAPRMPNAAPFCAAAFFALFEWLRGILFTGFPWLSMDHPHASASPLLGFAPVLGSFGLSMLACFLSALIAWAWPRAWVPHVRNSWAVGILIALMLAVGHGLKSVEWTTQAKAPPVTISLLQGNIAQELKFDPKKMIENMGHFEMLRDRSKGALIIMPETTITQLMRADPSEAFVTRMQALAKARNGAVIFGAPISADGKILNAAVGVDATQIQTYTKTHLVPFGEFMPLKKYLGWFYDNVAIPLAGFTPGAPDQTPMLLGGHALGLSICYEDVFARVLRSQALDATLLVNLTNDAWYGQSWAAEQHAQIAQMRAAEFGRPLVRATNTGVTTVIDHRGNELSRLPWFTRDVLETKLAGRTGLTPALAMGDLPPLLVCLAMSLIAIALRLQSRND